MGDSFDNALAETVNGYYKAELIRGLATLSWVHWHNHTRLHGYLNDHPPTEYEAGFHAAHGTDQHPVEIP